MKSLTLSLTCSNRPEYLAQVFEALSDCDKTDLDLSIVISVDKADPQVVTIAQNFDAIKVAQLVVNDPKIGCNQNTLQAIVIARQTNHSPYILHLEDDTVPTKDCLQFFSYAFEKYEKDANVLSIGGYNKTDDMDDDLIYELFNEPFFSAWGCGFWDSKLDTVIQHWSPSKTNNGMSWDSYLSQTLFEEKKYLQIKPKISRIQNIGAEKGTWVQDPMWHYYNHRTPYLSNDYTGLINWKEYAKNNQ